MAFMEERMDIDPQPSTSFAYNETVNAVSDANDSDDSYYVWIADSATTSHVSHLKNDFVDFVIVDEVIRGVGEIPVQVKGRGTIILTSYVENEVQQLKLRDVAYVPTAAMNLLSISSFEEHGGTAVMSNGRAILRRRNGHIAIIGKRQNGLYILDVKVSKPIICNIGREQKPTWLEWHKRFGHISISGLQRLHSKGFVEDFHVDKDSLFGDCEACIAGKQTRNPYAGIIGITLRMAGEMTHTDLWGPARTASVSGAKYYMTFIDDYSRHCTVKYLKHKNEATDKVRDYLTFIERQRNMLPKRLRADNGKEYVNNELMNWCYTKGVQLELTAPYSPQQNGVAERFNRTLAELTRAMLLSRHLPKSLWGAAVNHAAYVRNRAYTRALPDNTPEGRWTDKKPSVSKLYEFGAPVWVLREGVVLSKLDPRAQKHIFVGFEDGPNAIKYYDIKTRQIKVTHNYHLPRMAREDPTRFEGELRPDEPLWDAENVTVEINPQENDNAPEKMLSIPRKRARLQLEDSPPELRRSTRPKITHDYSQLNDPPIENDEFISRSSAELVYAAYGEASVTPEDPKNLSEAKQSPDWPEWEKAIKVELDQLAKMKTWKLTHLPKERKAITNKWVFVRKYTKEGKLVKYKARLVARGYSQILGMDYNDTYSPVVRLEAIRSITALAVDLDWEIQQMDVKGAYLNGILKEELYMMQPQGFTDGTDRVCHLIKTLYGLKQSGREWNKEFNTKLVGRNFKRTQSDPCVYIRQDQHHTEIVTVWVDDLLLFTNAEKRMKQLKRELGELFEVTDLGEPSKIVGIEISRDRKAGTLRLTQTKYIESLLRQYGLENANAVGMPMDPNIKLCAVQNNEPGDRSNSYASLIGSLMYLAVATRPDITYAVYQLAAYTANPGMQHWTAAKRVLRYLAGTKDWGITYRKNPSFDSTKIFHGYSDANFAGNEDGTSVTGFVFKSAGAAISWNSKRQRNILQSTTETEYMGLNEATREAVWLRNLFQELGFDQTKPTIIYGDNQGSLSTAVNPQFHKRTKHFQVKMFYVREQIQNEIIKVKYCPTAEMTADIFTKPLPKPKHLTHTSHLGMTTA